VDEETAEAASALFTDLAGDGEWIYRIHAGDTLEVVFFTHPEQNRFVTVRPDGRVTMPYVGELMAEGQTTESLGEELRVRYSEVLMNPQVDVIVHTGGGVFYVLGEVRVPGEFEYQRELSVMQACARAGGYSDKARLTNVVLLRKDADGRAFAAILNFRDLMGAQSKLGDIQIHPDDIVWVPKSNIARWDENARRLLTGMVQSEQFVIQGWSLANFKDVYQKGNRNP
jgi:polysaccharide export outer membrane protein